eukprot:755503-Hanusia_phi.AAC.1
MTPGSGNGWYSRGRDPPGSEHQPGTSDGWYRKRSLLEYSMSAKSSWRAVKSPRGTCEGVPKEAAIVGGGGTYRIWSMTGKTSGYIIENGPVHRRNTWVQEVVVAKPRVG